jgi:hypothetical protein
MNCADVRENISAYADNELDANERKLFEEHTSNCPECKKELDDMVRIIKLCRSMPLHDLPEGFRDELHEKLAAAASRNDLAAAGAGKPKWKLTAGTFASIAAVILLIFLGGSIVRFGLLSDRLGSKAADSASMTPAAGSSSGYSADDAADSGSESAVTEDGDSVGISSAQLARVMEPESADYLSKQAEANQGYEAPRSFDINRAISDEKRDNGISPEMDETETVSCRTSEVSVAAEDPAAALETVNALAAAYNAMMPAEEAMTYDQFSTGSISYHIAFTEESEARLKLHLTFADNDYRLFIAALNDAFGAANIQVGAYVIEDRTDELNMLIEKTNACDQLLKELHEKDDESSAGEIDRLKKEKEDANKRIESLRLNSDFITVTVHINEK